MGYICKNYGYIWKNYGIYWAKTIGYIGKTMGYIVQKLWGILGLVYRLFYGIYSSKLFYLMDKNYGIHYGINWLKIVGYTGKTMEYTLHRIYKA